MIAESLQREAKMADAAQRVVEGEIRLETPEPEILLPQQLTDRTRPGASALPEKRLMAPILEGAITTFQRYVGAKKPRGQILFREAEDWIECEDADFRHTNGTRTLISRRSNGRRKRGR